MGIELSMGLSIVWLVGCGCSCGVASAKVLVLGDRTGEIPGVGAELTSQQTKKSHIRGRMLAHLKLMEKEIFYLRNVCKDTNKQLEKHGRGIARPFEIKNEKGICRKALQEQRKKRPRNKH